MAIALVASTARAEQVLIMRRRHMSSFSRQFTTAEMILHLLVLDVHEQVSHALDYLVSTDDVRRWEEWHGRTPQVHLLPCVLLGRNAGHMPKRFSTLMAMAYPTIQA